MSNFTELHLTHEIFKILPVYSVITVLVKFDIYFIRLLWEIFFGVTTENWLHLNPFAPELAVRIHVLSTLCDVISFYGQGKLCPLTCAEWRDLSNHTRMSTIQSRTPEKEAKNHVTLTWKSPWKSCSIAHLPFLSPNPKILKAFL